MRRLRERWVAEHAEWERRSLAGRELVYAWADGIYVKAGLEKDKVARQVSPEAGEQRCWNHKMANVLDRLPKREHTEAKRRLREVVYAESRAGAEKARDAFADRYADTYPKAVEILAGDWGRMTAFFDFPAGHWRHLRTSAAKRFRKVDGAAALIWKLLMVAEKRFRKLNSPHLLPGVLADKRYADGKPVRAEERRAA